MVSLCLPRAASCQTLAVKAIRTEITELSMYAQFIVPVFLEIGHIVITGSAEPWSHVYVTSRGDALLDLNIDLTAKVCHVVLTLLSGCDSPLASYM